MSLINQVATKVNDALNTVVMRTILTDTLANVGMAGGSVLAAQSSPSTSMTRQELWTLFTSTLGEAIHQSRKCTIVPN